MKNKYQRLSKEEKKECQKMYYNTQKGKEMHLRFIRLTIIGIIGLLFSAYIFSTGNIDEPLKWYEYVLILLLVLSSLLFLVGTYKIKQKVLNQFALKIPRFKAK